MLTAPQKPLLVGDYWTRMFLEARHSNRNHLSIFQNIFMNETGKRISLIQFGENSGVGSTARNKSCMVHQKHKCLDKIYCTSAKCSTYIGERENSSELSRGHCGKTHQTEFCCHGLSKGLVGTRNTLSMEVILPKQCKNTLSFGAYNWQKYHYNDLGIKDNTSIGKTPGTYKVFSSVSPKEVKWLNWLLHLHSHSWRNYQILKCSLSLWRIF